MKRRIAIALVVFALLSSQTPSPSRAFTNSDQQSAAQSSAKTLTVAGLRDRVTLRRDERGIPYIEAKNDNDLYFAQGFVTASDRLWQMDLLRRTERGQLAEIFGAGPNNAALEQDKQHRTLGFAQVVDAEIAAANPMTRAVLDAYARGVNAFIASLDAKSLPPEFQILQYKPAPWTPADSLLVSKLFAEALSNTWRLDLMRSALASLPVEKRAGLLPEFSPLDVLVVGKDAKASKKSARSSGVSAEAWSSETFSHSREIRNSPRSRWRAWDFMLKGSRQVITGSSAANTR